MFDLQLIFLALAALGSSAPTPRYECKNENINVNSTWSLPLSWLADRQTCELNFIIPNGYFAVVDANATGLKGSWHGEEEFAIYDAFNDAIRVEDASLSTNVAYPANFYIFMASLSDTQMMVSITVSLKKATPTNVVANHLVGPNLPSTVIYLNELQEGTSISIKSEGNIIDLFTAFSSGDHNEYNNIFVYSNATFVGTMRKALVNKLKTAEDVLLYCAKKPISMGAVLAIDDSNIDILSSYWVFYSPVSQPAQTQIYHLTGGTSQHPEGLTIISDRDGSSAFDLRNIYTQTGQNSYIVSGPMLNFTSTPLTQSQLPKHFAGYINTFYNFGGQTNLKITVSG